MRGLEDPSFVFRAHTILESHEFQVLRSRRERDYRYPGVAVTTNLPLCEHERDE